MEINRDDKLNYLHALLGNRRFSKTFKYLGGKISIQFCTLSPDEEACIFDNLTAKAKACAAAGKAFTTEQWKAMNDQLRMICSLQQIIHDDQVFSPTERSPEKRQAQVIEYIQSASLFKLMEGAWKDFDTLVQFLDQKTDDIDFFAEIASGG